MADDSEKDPKKPEKTSDDPAAEGEGKKTEPHPLNVRNEKVIVSARAVFLKIGEIETVKECFSAELFIQAQWREPALDGLNGQTKKLNEIKWDEYWNPRLTVVNALGDPKEVIKYSVTFNDKKEALVCERRMVRSTFLENLELGEFPFDTQDISVTVMSERPETEVELRADSRVLSSVNVHSFVDEQEWSLYKHVITKEESVDSSYEATQEKHAQVSFTCRASRRVGFFVWNIFFVMFFICSMCYTTFALKYTLLPNRMQLTLIILLTTMTFKYTVNQSLPKISYLTYLDRYILGAMVSICLVCFWHAIVGSVLSDSLKEEDVILADRCFLLIAIAAYVGGHIAFAILVLIAIRRRRRRDLENEREYLERAKLLSEKRQSCHLELEK